MQLIERHTHLGEVSHLRIVHEHAGFCSRKPRTKRPVSHKLSQQEEEAPHARAARLRISLFILTLNSLTIVLDTCQSLKRCSDTISGQLLPTFVLQHEVS